MALTVAAGVLSVAALHAQHARLQDARSWAATYRAAYEEWRRYGTEASETAEHNYQAAEQWRVQAGRLQRDLDQLQTDYHRAQERVAFDPAFLEWLPAVMLCESTNNPQARNGTQWGLLQVDVQVHAARIARRGYQPEDLLRATPNLLVAQEIWLEQGGAPWPSCPRRPS
jgi:hypothetical protein